MCSVLYVRLSIVIVYLCMLSGHASCLVLEHSMMYVGTCIYYVSVVHY